MFHAHSTRFDVTDAAVRDTAPRFSCPISLDDTMARYGAPSESLVALAMRLNESQSSLSCLCESLIQLGRISALLAEHRNDDGFWKGGMARASMIAPLAHSALSIPRLASDVCQQSDQFSSVPLRESTRLAILIYVAVIKNSFGLAAAELKPLIDRQRRVASLIPPMSCFPELQAWADQVSASAAGSFLLSRTSILHTKTPGQSLPYSSELLHQAKALVWVSHLFEGHVITSMKLSD